jgi:hypothetical protein
MSAGDIGERIFYSILGMVVISVVSWSVYASCSRADKPRVVQCMEYSDTSEDCVESRTRMCKQTGWQEWRCGPWGPAWKHDD